MVRYLWLLLNVWLHLINKPAAGLVDQLKSVSYGLQLRKCSLGGKLQPQ